MTSLVPNIYFKKGTWKVFRRIYRALVISSTKSAAIKFANQLSQHDLNDIGVSRYEFIRQSVEVVRKEFAESDRIRAEEAASNKTGNNVISDFIATALLRPLGPSRS